MQSKHYSQQADAWRGAPAMDPFASSVGRAKEKKCRASPVSIKLTWMSSSDDCEQEEEGNKHIFPCDVCPPAQRVLFES